jgi:hypothetical protein
VVGGEDGYVDLEVSYVCHRNSSPSGLRFTLRPVLVHNAIPARIWDNWEDSKTDQARMESRDKNSPRSRGWDFVMGSRRKPHFPHRSKVTIRDSVYMQVSIQLST